MRLLLALVACALAVAGRAAAVAEPLRDDRGVAIVLPESPRRIVSLLPSLTESVCVIGACPLLVGTDRFSNWPASVATLPKLGGLDDAQVEAIVALKPDLVLVSSSARVIERLEGLGLRVVVLESRDRADVRRTLDLLGRLLQREAAASAVWQDIEHRVDAAAARVPAAVRGRRVYFEIDSTPYAAGSTSFIGETLQRLGMRNALPPALGPFPKLNPELVVRLQPDVVMAGRPSVDEMPQRPGWSALRALRDGQVCAFPGPRHELLTRPGPRLGEAAEIVAECLAGLPARP